MAHQIILPGRITKDAVMRYTQDGKAVSNFDLAVDDGFGSDKKTIWFRCSLWGKLAEALTDYLKKGTPATVFGNLAHDEGNPRIWQGKDGAHASFEVFVNDIVLQGGKRQNTVQNDDDDNIPF
jgi:single-strand DNA-binding protein